MTNFYLPTNTPKSFTRTLSACQKIQTALADKGFVCTVAVLKNTHGDGALFTNISIHYNDDCEIFFPAPDRQDVWESLTTLVLNLLSD